MKLLTSIFGILYLALSLNLSLNFHYCFGDLKDVSFFSDQVEACCEKFQEDPPCCDFEKLNLELGGFQLPAEKLVVQFFPLQFIQQLGEVVTAPAIVAETVFEFADSSPPLLREMLIFFRGLLFYE